jgi:hypothetical protein
VTTKENVIIFGGTNFTIDFNDVWILSKNDDTILKWYKPLRKNISLKFPNFILVDCQIFTEELCSPDARSMHSATLWEDYMVVYGGVSVAGKVYSDFYLFDTTTSKWYSVYNGAYPRAGHTLLRIPNTDVYFAIGGIESRAKYATTVLKMRFGWAYANPSGQWAEEKTGFDYEPKRRAYHAMAGTGNVLYVHGGENRVIICTEFRLFCREVFIVICGLIAFLPPGGVLQVPIQN